MKKTLLILICLSIGFYACDDIPVNDNTPINTQNIVLDFFKGNLDDAKQIHTVDVTSTVWVYGDLGTYIQISPCSFLDADGNEVTGEIEFELIEAQTNIDMLKLNRPTFTSDGQLLVSGGILYVNATQNGEALSINPNCGLQANMPNTSNNAFDGEMRYFSGDENEDGIFGWEEEDDTVTAQTWQEINSWFTLGFEIDSIGWINCDYFYDSQGDLTDIEMQLPQGYDGSNSQGFIFYEAINSCASLTDPDQDGIFSLPPGYETPVGMTVKLVAISGDSINDYYYHITSPTTVNMNHYEIITNMTGPTSHSDLETLLNNL